MKCSLHPEALIDYRRATLYYGERGRVLGEAFATEVEAAIGMIRAAPRARAANGRGLRRFLVRRFPYVLHYAIEQEPIPDGAEFIVVYALRHSKQDQAYMLHRLPPVVGG